MSFFISGAIAVNYKLIMQRTSISLEVIILGFQSKKVRNELSFIHKTKFWMFIFIINHNVIIISFFNEWLGYF